MKNLFLLLAICTFIFSSCKKEIPLIQKHFPDTILYTDIRDTTVTSIRRITSYYVVPSDSSAWLKLDLDGDGTKDIYFSESHSYSFVSASNPLANYPIINSISMINNCDSMTSKHINNTMRHVLKILNLGDTINSHLMYSKDLGYNYSEYNITLGNGYIGFKLYRNLKTYLGWIKFSNSSNRMTIKEFAINKTAGNSIIAGQTE